MAALRFGLKCSRTNVYAPLLNQIDALEASLNLLRLDMSSRDSGALEHKLLFLRQLLIST